MGTLEKMVIETLRWPITHPQDPGSKTGGQEHPYNTGFECQRSP